MSLSLLGWSDVFNAHNPQAEDVARIIAIHRSHLRAITLNGEINIHYSGGSLQIPVAVGDWVTTTPLFVDEQNQSAALIKELIPRKSKISRVTAGDEAQEQVIAANIDIVFVVTSINQDFNFNRLQRYLLLIKKGLARPVVVLSKIDLNSSYTQILKDLNGKLDEDILVIATSSVSKEGIDQIEGLMPEGSTSVFVGSSGVGKSSLVNSILGQDIQTVREIREDDGKGKHATTSRQMFFVPNKGMIIDTPGIREVSIFGSEEHLSETFHEIEELMIQCKYSNCNHITEPGCAILHAIESKEVEKEEWENYKKLAKEVAFNNSKLNKQASSNTKKKWKQIQTDYKARKKFKGKN